MSSMGALVVEVLLVSINLPSASLLHAACIVKACTIEIDCKCWKMVLLRTVDTHCLPYSASAQTVSFTYVHIKVLASQICSLFVSSHSV